MNNSKINFGMTIFALFEGARAALQAIFAHGLRSSLTSLGIIIGVCSVITVVAVMGSLGSFLSQNLKDLGSDMVTLKAYTNTEQEMLGNYSKITYSDFELLKSKVTGVQHMTARMKAFSLSEDINYRRKSTQAQIIGTDSSYQNVVNVFPEKGRFINQRDDRRRNRVVFIGPTIIKDLEITGDPIGQFLQIGADWFKIIGVAEAKGTMFGFDQDNYVVTPYSTLRSLKGSSQTDDINIIFKPKANQSLEKVQRQMTRLLRQKYKISNDEENFFEFETAEKVKSQFNDITQMVTLVASGVVGISLLVGGIGIMNIMLVSVTERTKEIGISKAIGATPTFILIQFLVEALVLSLFGGIVGVIMGYCLAGFLMLIIPGMNEILVPIWAITLSLGFTTVIGIVFGLAPALKASKLNPVDALRYE